ncbi:hypothetical protein AG1IA_00701 [Rhizoctonia solani AG-1 IA]|uniref:Uncharacterized protein n=1 Tax=Thanatephorus cucumeris (strain AG1-IA) TaxID=983506 RepID=L8X885_THACA|nr:hypothetical protein AG1IA_00701 [Rhizoctonia solani AG-1 IA]
MFFNNAIHFPMSELYNFHGKHMKVIHKLALLGVKSKQLSVCGQTYFVYTELYVKSHSSELHYTVVEAL